jgi:hypothetical protein
MFPPTDEGMRSAFTVRTVMLAMQLSVYVLGFLIDSHSQGTVPGQIIFFEKDQRSAKS